METDNDSEWISAARAGDPVGIGALYEAHAAIVYTTAYRMVLNRADAQDVLQDVFVGLPRALASYQERGGFRSWLRSVTVRTALVRLRTQRRKAEVDLDTDAMQTALAAPTGADPVDAIALQRAIAGLPEKLRVVFMLRELEGYSHDEIAALLAISAGASATRTSRAWNHLRKELEL